MTFSTCGQVVERFEVLMRAFVANRADDRALDAAHDVRFVAELFDFLEHGGFVFFRNVRFKNNDHIFVLFGPRVVTKKPQVATCGRLSSINAA